MASHLEDLRALLIVSQLQLAEEKDITKPYQERRNKRIDCRCGKSPRRQMRTLLDL